MNSKTQEILHGLGIWVLFVAIILAILLMVSCTTQQIECFEQGKCGPTPTPTPAPKPLPSPTPKKEVATVSKQTIPAVVHDASWLDELAAKSKCAAYSWKNRGHAPKGYIKGMVRVYARAVCQASRPEVLPLFSGVKSDPKYDGVAHYGLKGDELLSTYALLIGLGMRESSGNYCCGRDMTMDFKRADSAEAGLFQASWGAHDNRWVPVRVQNVMVQLFEQYRKDPSDCLLSTFKEGVGKCSSANLKNWGEGTGAEWQKLTKSCPAFATEYAALVLRYSGGANGEFAPIRHNKAEVNPSCVTLLTQVQRMLGSRPDLCVSL